MFNVKPINLELSDFQKSFQLTDDTTFVICGNKFHFSESSKVVKTFSGGHFKCFACTGYVYLCLKNQSPFKIVIY